MSDVGSRLTAVLGAITTEVTVVFEGDDARRPDGVTPLGRVALAIALSLGALSLVAVHGLSLLTAYWVAVRDRGIVDVVSLPGIGPLQPLADVWIVASCLVIAIAVHEGGHLFANRLCGVRLRAVGVGLACGLPFKCFTRYDREDWATLSARRRAAIRSAGIAVNVGVAAVAFGVALRFGSEVASWLCVVNAGLALVSAVPLSGTDGDLLLPYLVTGGDSVREAETPRWIVLLVGTGSWVLVVGTVLLVVVTSATG